MTRRISTPHDHFFRAAMSEKEVAKAFFEAHLPAHILNQVDLSTLILRKESFIDEELAKSITDLLFSVNFNQCLGYLYLLVEHRSKPRRLQPLTMLKYLVRALEDHCKQTESDQLPIIVPLVFYHGKRTPYPYPTALSDLFDDPSGIMKDIVTSQFYLVDIGQIPDEVMRERAWLNVLQLCAKHVFDRDFLPYWRKELIGILKPVLESGGENYITATLTYLLNAAEMSDRKAFLETIRHELTPEIGDHIMTIAQQLKAEGKAEGELVGLEKGLERGLEKGLEKGRFIEKQSLARKLLQEGMQLETVSHLTELSLAEVQALADALKH